MKIVAGMGSIDDYVEYVKAGADEVFIGYVPQNYQLKYGIDFPLNRREVCYYNVQIGSKSELEILHVLVEKYKVPVSITFNSLNYSPELYPVIIEIIEEILDIGFKDVIIADFALLLHLKLVGLCDKLNIHLSGEIGEINHYLLTELSEFNVKRVIFHRKVSHETILKLINQSYTYEYEAFILNEMCHFNGGYCNTVHNDELVPMCRMPYILSDRSEIKQTEYKDVPGADGCGLCSLWWMKNAGVTHLKVVGRGGYTEKMLRDIQSLRRSLDILKESKDENEYINKMKNEIFTAGCGQNCYYL